MTGTLWANCLTAPAPPRRPEQTESAACVFRRGLRAGSQTENREQFAARTLTESLGSRRAGAFVASAAGQRLTALPPLAARALGLPAEAEERRRVRSCRVRPSAPTYRVALAARTKPPQTLALSRLHAELVNSKKATGGPNATGFEPGLAMRAIYPLCDRARRLRAPRGRRGMAPREVISRCRRL